MQEKDDITRKETMQTLPLPPEKQEEEAVGVDKGVARFAIGQSVRHRKFGFQGVIFDVDPEFANTQEWYESIPEEIRPRKDQPFYHLFALNPVDNSSYIAYVSQQNLDPLPPGEEVAHPQLEDYFDTDEAGGWRIPDERIH